MKKEVICLRSPIGLIRAPSRLRRGSLVKRACSTGNSCPTPYNTRVYVMLLGERIDTSAHARYEVRDGRGERADAPQITATSSDLYE